MDRGQALEALQNPTPLTTMQITNGAYSEKTEWAIRQFIDIAKTTPKETQIILMFALCAILESVSYTRKDGQYLRWDYRSGRRVGKKPFDKGLILEFDEAMQSKLNDVVDDLDMAMKENLFSQLQKNLLCEPEFLMGSSLDELMQIPCNSFSAVITSPPYCNRYDYTRTYALELAALGVDSDNLIAMRQTMLSCTVENRAKDLVAINQSWKKVIEYTHKHPALRVVLDYMWEIRTSGKLNNNGIPRMIEGYFTEMACIIFECARLLKKGGAVAVVNDNVRYAGVAIPVDMILSDIANFCGINVEKIMVLPQGKGNSSQQMGLMVAMPYENVFMFGGKNERFWAY